MNGFGVFVVTTTWPVRLFAVVVAPTGTPTPRYGDLFAGLRMKSRFRLMTVAVIGLPSEHVMPRRSVNSPRFGDRTRHDRARFPARRPGPVTLTSVSYVNDPTVRAAPSSVRCGSRLPGSVAIAIVSVPDAAGAAGAAARSGAARPSEAAPARIATDAAAAIVTPQSL